MLVRMSSVVTSDFFKICQILSQESESKYFWVNGVMNGGENVVADVWEKEEPK